jgi:DNA-binding transcriptional ArsR family regulator/rhodanese-related sulfurtransferase
MGEQLSLLTEYEETQVERQALIRGALHNAGCTAAEVAKLYQICRELYEAEGAAFAPSVEDLVIRTGDSRATVTRRLRVLVEVGVVTVERQAGASARDPKRRSIDWERTARLARRQVMSSPVRSVEAISSAHGEPTKSSSAHGEPTKPEIEPTSRGADSFDLYISPPTPSSPPNEPRPGGDFRTAGDEPDRAAWRSVRREVRAAGVTFDGKACEAARANGATPADVRAIVEYFRSKPGCWTPAVLKGVIDGATAGCDPAEGWPPPDPEADRAARRDANAAALDRRTADQAAEAEQRRRQAIDDARRLAELEQLHGAAIDRCDMPEIVARLEATQRGKLAALVRRSGARSPLVREQLLEVWEQLAAG